jgi:hypothetical protein
MTTPPSPGLRALPADLQPAVDGARLVVPDVVLIGEKSTATPHSSSNLDQVIKTLNVY